MAPPNSLEHLQGWGIHSSSEQSVPEPHQVKNFSSTRTPKSFSTGLLSMSCSSNLYSHLELPQHKCPSLLNLIRASCLLFKHVQVPLDSIPPFCCVNCTTQLGVISKLAEGTLNPTVLVIDKDVKEHWSQEGPLGDASHHQPPSGLRAIDNNLLATAV